MSEHTGAYQKAYDTSISDPDTFWGEAAKDIDWITPPTRVLDASQAPFYRWFTDGTLNTCHNAVDRHVEGGRADQVAIHYDSPVTGTKRAYTYADVLAHVKRVAGALVGVGVTAGDRVVIYMPMVPEAVFAMLACARIGADPLGRLRRLRPGRAAGADRRCPAQGHPLGVLRPGAGPGRALQAVPRRGHRAF